MYFAYNRNGDIVAKHESYDELVRELTEAGYGAVDYFITPSQDKLMGLAA